MAATFVSCAAFVGTFHFLGIGQIVGQIHAGHVDRLAARIVDLDPVVGLALRVAVEAAIGGHQLVDNQGDSRRLHAVAAGVKPPRRHTNSEIRIFAGPIILRLPHSNAMDVEHTAIILRRRPKNKESVPAKRPVLWGRVAASSPQGLGDGLPVKRDPPIACVQPSPRPEALRLPPALDAPWPAYTQRVESVLCTPTGQSPPKPAPCRRSSRVSGESA